MGYLNNHELLSHHQIGFRQGRSTVDQLILVYDNICEAIDSGKTVDLILFDYSKAFNKVCHKVLLVKLKSIGINGQILEWISSSLTGWEMKVSVND